MGYWWQTERPKEATSVQRCWLGISQGHVHSQFKNQPVFLVRNPAPADKANSKRNAFPQGWQTLTFTPHQWMWSDIRPLPASSVNSRFQHLNIWIGPRTQKPIEWHLNGILIISSKSYAKPPKLTVTANAASSQTQTEDMAAKINVTVPFKISHKASPCRGGHCSRDVFFFFFKCLLIFSFFKKEGEPKNGTIRRAVSETKSRASSACSPFSSSAKTSGWRAICGDVGRNAHSAGQPRSSPLNVGHKIYWGQKDLEIKGCWNLRRRFKGPTMAWNVS